MKIRYAKKTEKKIALEHWKNSFTDSDEEIKFYFDNIFKHKNFLVLENNKKIVSSLHENPYILNFNSNKIKTKYIVGVSTPITEQRKGYMSILIKEMLKISKTEMPFVFLTPINPDIYRRYGFEYFSKIEKYSFSIENLSEFKINKELNFIEINLTNKDKYMKDLMKIYNKNMKTNFFSFLERDDYYFDKLLLECLNDEMKIFISYKNNRPQAYIIFSKYEKTINVRESFALDFEEYQNIIGLLYAYRDYYKEISISSAENFNLEYLFKNQLNIKKEINPFMMLRILEPLKVLNYAKLNIENLKIYVVDNILEENTGTYIYNNKKWTFSNKDENYDFKINIADLTSLITGFFDFNEMLFMKKIILNINKESRIKELSELFKRKKSYLYEFQ